MSPSTQGSEKPWDFVKDKTALWPTPMELVARGHGARPAWVPAWLHRLLDVLHQHEPFGASVSLPRKMTITNASVSIVLITGWIRRVQCQHQLARQGPLNSQESSQVVVTGIKGPPMAPCLPLFPSNPWTLPASCLICAPLKMPFGPSFPPPLIPSDLLLPEEDRRFSPKS